MISEKLILQIAFSLASCFAIFMYVSYFRLLNQYNRLVEEYNKLWERK